MAVRRFYGIDLGTTHTVVVKATKEGSSWKYTKLKLPNMPISGLDDIVETELLPSAVYFSEDGRVIVGQYAKEAIHSDPERVYINAKIDLGGRLRVNESNEHTPLEVSAEILKVCFSKIVQDGGANASVRISVPAAFSQDKRKDTERAAEMALESLGYTDIKVISTTEEPFAALVNMVVNERRFIDIISRAKNTVMLIDIGGGTMDIIISEFSYSGNVLNAKMPYEPAKHDEFAGARFDFELMKKFMEDFLNHYELLAEDVPDKDRIHLEKSLLIKAEDAKKFLCNKENSNRVYEFTCDFQGLSIDLSHKKPFQISLTKRQMDMALEGLLNTKQEYGHHQSIKQIIRKTLTDNGLPPQDIDCIYLTGGMAYYDRISESIQSVIHKPVIVAEEPLFCTATGVALSLVIQTPDGKTELKRQFKNIIPPPPKKDDPNDDPNIEKNNPQEKINPSSGQVNLIEEVDTKLIECNRMGVSYFIDVEDSMPVEIISKNETYPCIMKKSNIQLRTTSQSRLSLILYEGQSVYDCGMKLLRKKTVEFPEMVNVGTKIDISYEINTKKLITIYASVNGEAPFKFSTDEE